MRVNKKKYLTLSVLLLLTGSAAVILISFVSREQKKEVAVELETNAARSAEPISPPQIATTSDETVKETSPRSESDVRNELDVGETSYRPNTAASKWMIKRSETADKSLFKSREDETPETEEEEDGDRPDAPDEALRFRNLQLKDEKGEIPLDGLQKAREQMDRMREFTEKRAKETRDPEELEIAGLDPGDWAWLGPGNVGGRIRSIVIDPNNANNIWVGSVGGGIWKTTNAGTTWQPVNDFLANLAVSTMVINPNNATIMYAGTGEGFGNVDALQGGGVFQSTNSGVTWNLLASTNPAAANPPGCGAIGTVPCSNFWNFVNRLAISQNGGTILAATGGGIAQSIDGGATWIQRTSIVAQDVDFDPSNNTNAVASELTQCPPPPPGVPCAAIGARFSTNGGNTWAAATFTPGITNGRTSATDGRVELAYAPSSSNIVYASVNNNNGDVYQSTNGGQTFTQVDNTTNNLLGTQGWYDNIIWVNPQDPTFVVVGGVDLFRSTDSGANFTQISRWQCGPGQSVPCPGPSAHADQHMIVSPPGFNNSTNKTVYFSNDGGMFRVNDVSTVAQTSGWINLNNNLGITQFYGGAITPTGTIFGGAQDNGTIRVQPTPNIDPPYDTQSWQTPTNGGGDGGYVAADPTDANYLYGERQNLALFRSSDAGATVNTINAGITDTASSNFIAPFVLDPGNVNTMLAGSLSLWRSSNVKAAAPTWTAIKQPVPPLPPAPGAAPSPTPPISAIAISPTNSNFVVVGHNDGQIYLSQDGAGTNPPTSPAWTRIDNAAVPLPSRFVTRIAIDNTRVPNWIYVTFGGFSNNNVWVTRDLGTTWVDVSGAAGTSTDLPAVPVRSILLGQANANNLYVGTEVGVFASQDGGATWQLPQGGPANVSVDELFFSPQGFLMAATHGRGIYTTRLPVSDLPACGFTGDPGGSCPSPSVRCGMGCCVPGDWDCPCTWNNRQIPTQNDDVVVTCPITVNSPSTARNLRVDGRLSLAGGSVAVQQDVVNIGLIESVGPSSSNISCNNVVNIRPENFASLRGIININQQWTVRGDIANYGIISGAGINLNGQAGVTQTLGGNGEWNSAFMRIFRTAQLSTDLAVDNGSINVQPFAKLKLNNRTLTMSNSNANFTSAGGVDLGSGTLNFKGNQFFITNPNNGDPDYGFKGTGTVILNPSSGTAEFSTDAIPNVFQPSLRIQSGTINSIFRATVGGSFIVDPGATFNLNEGGMTVNGDVTVNGTIARSNSFSTTVLNFNGATFANNGSVFVDFLTFNTSGASRPQTIIGTGTWVGGTSFSFGINGSPSTTTLGNDLTFNQAQLGVASSHVLDLRNFTLTYTGANLTVAGRVIGTGTIRMQRTGTAALTATGTGSLEAAVRIASGTVNPSLRMFGPFTIDPGATLSGGNGMFYVGNSFTNNGSVVSTSLTFGSANFQPINQQLGGTGTFAGPGGNLVINGESTTTLSSNLTYGGPSLFVQGRINTGLFTFSVPCTTTWQGAGEVVGNIRRTNLAACPGAAFVFGNPFTTIRFTSGTPPSEIAFSSALSAPASFTNAVRRTYVITPTGGSGYIATLRLRYLDAELNSNTESSLQLWRNNGTNWTVQGASSRNITDNWVEFNNVTQFSPWAISQFAPVGFSVSGRIRNAEGRGVTNATVTLDDSGSIRTVTTGRLGVYRFDGVPGGRTYLLRVNSRRFTFPNNPRMILVSDNIANEDFTANP